MGGEHPDLRGRHRLNPLLESSRGGVVSLTVYFTLYALTFAVSLLGLTLLAQFDTTNRLFFRVLTGGSFGAVSAWWLQGFTPALSYLEACLNGDLGIGGYLALVSLNVLAGVWILNLVQTRRVLVV